MSFEPISDQDMHNLLILLSIILWFFFCWFCIRRALLTKQLSYKNPFPFFMGAYLAASDAIKSGQINEWPIIFIFGLIMQSIYLALALLQAHLMRREL